MTKKKVKEGGDFGAPGSPSDLKGKGGDASACSHVKPQPVSLGYRPPTPQQIQIVPSGTTEYIFVHHF